MTGARYDAVTDFYTAGWTDRYDDSPSVALFELTGPVAGRDVLDLACGHGRVARELARRGGNVTGIDISAGLLARAGADEVKEPLGVTYVLGDVSSDSTLADSAFDLVVCSFGLSDIDDLDGALKSVARVLRPGGAFVFSTLHPCFPGGPDVAASWPPGSGYFGEGWWLPDDELSTLRRQVGTNHRTLATYMNALTAHGLPVDAVIEPRPDAAWASRRPGLDSVPVFLVARCRRADMTELRGAEQP